METLNTTTFRITPEILSLISEIDEFKGAWRAIGRIAPERLSGLRCVARIESVGSSTRIEGARRTDREVEKLQRHPDQFRRVVQHVATAHDTEPAATKFLNSADSFLIARARAMGATVITHEPNRGSQEAGSDPRRLQRLRRALYKHVRGATAVLSKVHLGDVRTALLRPVLHRKIADVGIEHVPRL